VEQENSTKEAWGYSCNAVISSYIHKTLENVFQGLPRSKTGFWKIIQLTSKKDGMNFTWHFNSPVPSEDYRHHEIRVLRNG